MLAWQSLVWNFSKKMLKILDRKNNRVKNKATKAQSESKWCAFTLEFVVRQIQVRIHWAELK